VDVAVQAQQRPHLLHGLQHPGRADRPADQVAGRGLEPEVLIKNRRRIQAGPKRRAVD
jgi:hypothetical protein